MKKLMIFSLSIAALFSSCEKDSLESTPQEQQIFELGSKSSAAHVGSSVFVSSNTSGMLTSFNIGTGLASPSPRAFSLPYQDADGIVYDGKRNALYHVNRSDNMLVAIPEISTYLDGDMVSPSAMGPQTFMQGREATLYNNKVVVVDDQSPGQLKSYHVNVDNISDYRQHQVDFELWGIQATEKDLWAVVDVTNKIALFQDYFKAKSGDLDATSIVGIEGLVRTHGLNYDADNDVMVLTDIADAGNPADGALVIIENFRSKFMQAGDGGTISLADQVRIVGSSTQLGNPVDVKISNQRGAIFVAERASEGGKFLVFEYPSSGGNIAPLSSTLVAGASAVESDFH